jgi:antitoxin VapB
MRKKAKVFKNGRSQAVRIPKEFRLNCDEVYIEKVDDKLVVKPIKTDKWDKLFVALKKIDTSDFLKERNQLPTQTRELF